MSANRFSSSVFVDAGVDYITATSSEQKANDFFESYASRLIAEERGNGNEVSHFWLAGYSGLSCGSVQAATCGESRLVRLSSHLAKEHWKVFAESASNVSRFDLQVTIQFGAAELKLVEYLEKRALEFEREHNHGRQIELRRNSVKGKTLYVGSRRSDRFIRCYDKGAESGLGQHGILWRAEIELHRRLAKRGAFVLLGSESEEQFIMGTVSAELNRVGMPWKRSSTGSVLKSSSARVRSDADKKLTWLNQQVRPTVQQLLDQGRLTDVIECLGLDHVVLDHEKE